MPNSNISFGKIVASPTPSSWSQAYNAGGLFAVIALSQEKIEETEDTQENQEEITEAIEAIQRKKEDNSLQILGKELINTLEEEYFTLEEKTAATIQLALEKTLDKIPEEVDCSLLVISIIGNILYGFSSGKGSIILVRGTTYSRLLTGNEERAIQTISGNLATQDRIILQTDSFATIVPLSKIITLENPQEAAEILSPLVHHKKLGDASAIIISYASIEPVSEIAPSQELSPSIPLLVRLKNSAFLLKRFVNFSLPVSFKIKNQRYIVIAGFLLVLLVGTILFTTHKKKSAKQQAFFKQVYSSAQSKYDEGQSLVSLNKNLAKDDFQAALKIIEDNKKQFAKGSKEEQELTNLSQKINDALSGSSALYAVEASDAQGKSTMLEAESKDLSIQFATYDDSLIYALDGNGVTSIDKKTDKTKKIIEKDNNWISPKGIGVFYDNIYILDTSSKQIFKFVSQGSKYSKTDYFAPGVTPDLSKAVSMAIDGSVWILGKDGSLQKYTRGKQDSFSVSGLDIPLSNPTRIFTNKDVQKLYILDNSNSRVVVLDKNGAYLEQYGNKLLSQAKDLDVLEKDKKLYFLAQKKVWQINLK